MSSYEQQLVAQARQVERDRLNDASNIDAAVPPAERARLQSEQDEFLGIDREAEEAAREEGKAGLPGRRLPGGAAPAPSSPASGPRPMLPFEDVDGGAIADSAAPTLEIEHSQEEWLEFLTGRDYWVGDDGDIWHVEALDDGTVTMNRNHDPDGQVDPPQIGPQRSPIRSGGALGYLEHVPAKSASGGASTGDPDVEGAHGHPLDDHDHDGEFAVAAPATIDEAVERQEVLGKRVPADAMPPADIRTASGMSIMMPDGSAVTSTTTEERWDVGIARTTTERQRVSDVAGMSGFENYQVVDARRDDGSSARTTDRVSIGVYSRADEASDDATGDAGVALTPFDTQTTVTVTGADGSRRSTDSERPSPRETPTTIDELRVVQDELGIAYDAIGSQQDRPEDLLDAVFQDATVTMTRIDADELQRAAQEGARGIAASDPDAIIDYADATFDDVREQFEAFGLDAAAGNEQIDRDWISDDRMVHMNAAYFPTSDEMKFGTLDDGTPFAASADVIAHEFAHRITEHNGGVRYEGESGAINESLSDTLAAAIDTEDWLVGEDLIAGGVRDMSVERTMADFVETTDDHGGVHTNSAIPNYAAYLIGEDIGREPMGRIYARTMDQYLSPDMQFTDLARGTWQAAVDLYGETSREAAAVREAWDGVLLLDGDASIFDPVGVGSGGGGGGTGGSW